MRFVFPDTGPCFHKKPSSLPRHHIKNIVIKMAAVLTLNLALQKAKADRPSVVKRLNVCGAQLEDISVLEQFSNVEVVSLSVNDVTDLAGLSKCECLRELYLRRNDVCELEQLLHLSNLLELKVLSLVDNPVADLPGYREYTIAAIPSLEKLDDVEVSKVERATAEAAYPDLFSASKPPPGHGATAAAMTPRRVHSQPGSATASPQLIRRGSAPAGAFAAAPGRSDSAGSEEEVEPVPPGRTFSYGNDDIPVGGGRPRRTPAAVPPIVKPATPRVTPGSFGRTVESGSFEDDTPKKTALRPTARRVDPTVVDSPAAAPSVPEVAVLRAVTELLRDVSPAGLMQLRRQIDQMLR